MQITPNYEKRPILNLYEIDPRTELVPSRRQKDRFLETRKDKMMQRDHLFVVLYCLERESCVVKTLKDSTPIQVRNILIVILILKLNLWRLNLGSL